MKKLRYGHAYSLSYFTRYPLSNKRKLYHKTQPYHPLTSLKEKAKLNNNKTCLKFILRKYNIKQRNERTVDKSITTIKACCKRLLWPKTLYHYIRVMYLAYTFLKSLLQLN